MRARAAWFALGRRAASSAHQPDPPSAQLRRRSRAGAAASPRDAGSSLASGRSSVQPAGSESREQDADVVADADAAPRRAQHVVARRAGPVRGRPRRRPVRHAAHCRRRAGARSPPAAGRRPRRRSRRDSPNIRRTAGASPFDEREPATAASAASPSSVGPIRAQRLPVDDVARADGDARLRAARRGRFDERRQRVGAAEAVRSGGRAAHRGAPARIGSRGVRATVCPARTPSIIA